MKKAVVYFIIFFHQFLNACTQDRQSLALDPSKKLDLKLSNTIVRVNNNPIHLELETDEVLEIDFNSYFSIDDIIYLDKNDLVGDVEKLIAYENHYYVFDKARDLIHSFDKDGKKVWSISNQGPGPEEYFSIRDFDIDYESGDLHLWDSRSLKVLVYDIQSGDLIKINRNQSFGREILVFNNNYFLYPMSFYNEDQAYRLLVTDRDNNLVRRALPFESFDYDNSYLPSRVFSKINNDSFFMTTCFTDTVYRYYKDTLNAEFVVSINGNRISNYGQDLDSEGLIQNLNNFNIHKCSISNLTLFKDRLYFTFSSFSEGIGYFVIYSGIYDYLNQDVKVFKGFSNNPFSWRDDLFDGEFIFSSEEFAYLVIDPSIYNALREQWEEISTEGFVIKDYISVNFPLIYDVIQKTDNDDNPFIVKLKIKDF